MQANIMKDDVFSSETKRRIFVLTKVSQGRDGNEFSIFYKQWHKFLRSEMWTSVHKFTPAEVVEREVKSETQRSRRQKVGK
jgi:hypothetical protein